MCGFLLLSLIFNYFEMWEHILCCLVHDEASSSICHAAASC